MQNNKQCQEVCATGKQCSRSVKDNGKYCQQHAKKRHETQVQIVQCGG